MSLFSPELACSVVLMNWSRPANVRMLAAFYDSCPIVREVVVIDPSPTCRLHVSELPPSTQHVTTRADCGLYLRFSIAALCRYDPILIVDDDLQPREKTLNRLVAEWKRQPDIIHGVFGRESSAYSSTPLRDRHGPVEIVLTRLMATSRLYCARALGWSVQQLQDLPQAIPRGNGEDITISFVAMASSGKLNLAHDLPVVELPEGPQPIHRRWPGHRRHRSRVVTWCKENILAHAEGISSRRFAE